MQTTQKNERYTFKRIALGIWNRVKLYAEGVGSLFPKLIYGNNAGAINNFMPYLELRKARRTFNTSSINLKEDPFFSEAAFLKKHGYFLIKSETTDGLSEVIKRKLADKIYDPSESFASASGATRYLLDPFRAIPELKDLLSDHICKTILSYYQCPLRIGTIRVWRNFHVPGVDPDKDDRFSNTFHNDNYAVTGLRVFILLCDGVTRKTGAFRFHDKINSSKMIRSLGYFHRYKMPKNMRKKLLDPDKLKHFEGDFGDIAICNTQECLHAASIPKEGSFRDILQFEVYPDISDHFNKEQLFSKIPTDTQLLSLMK